MHKLRLLSLLTLFAILVGQGQGFAQEVAEQPCDPAVYQQMKSRAWLEAEREIMQNQNLIFKADSVLEYTCFDQFLNFTSGPGGNIFTHNETFFDGIILPRGEETGLEAALGRVVLSSMASYIEDNFSHDFLGGRGAFLDIQAIPPDGEIEEELATGNEVTYLCDRMAEIWHTSKCLNFIHVDEFLAHDGFYPFDTIVGIDAPDAEGYDVHTDIRPYPVSCGEATGVTTFEAELEIAENEPEKYQFQTPLGELFLDVFEKTEPGECFGFGVLTGVQVILSEGPAHQDGVCTNPGCTYTAEETCE